MRWILILLVLAYAMPVVAGEIVIGICSECGYQTDEFFTGYGVMPGYAAEVYRSPETGEFHLVRFNIIEIEAEEIAVIINNSYDEVVEISVTWSSPEVLGEISMDGILPAGAHLNDELSEDPLNWELVSLDVMNICPACGGGTLEFHRIGNWD